MLFTTALLKMGSFVSGSVVDSVNRPLTVRGANWPVRLIEASNEITLLSPTVVAER